jgi:hypothetical protein
VDSVVKWQGKGLGFDSAPFIFQKINISSYFSGLMLLKLSTRALLSRFFVLILRLSICHSVKKQKQRQGVEPRTLYFRRGALTACATTVNISLNALVVNAQSKGQ